MASVETIRQYQVPRFKVYCRRSGVSIYPDDVMPDSFEYTAGTETDDGFGPGAVQAQSLTFQIRNHDGSKSGAFQRGDRIELHFGYGSTVETTTWEKLAELDVQDVTRARYNLSVIAYDGISFSGDSLDEFIIPSPNTIGGIMKHCAQCMGTDLAAGTIHGGSIPVKLREASDTDPQSLGLTARQELSEACRMSGNWAKMDKNGKIVCGWYPNEPSVILPEDFVFDYQLGEEPVTYTGVRVAGRDVKGSTSGAVYRMDDDAFLTSDNVAAAETAMYGHLNGRRVFSMDVTCVADLAHIVPGGVMQGTYLGPAPGDDVSEFGDKFAIQTPITSITWNGGMLMNVKCTVSAASMGDDRATGSTDAANKAIRDQLKNPNSELSQAIGQGGGGGGSSETEKPYATEGALFHIELGGSNASPEYVMDRSVYVDGIIADDKSVFKSSICLDSGTKIQLIQPMKSFWPSRGDHSHLFAMWTEERDYTSKRSYPALGEILGEVCMRMIATGSYSAHDAEGASVIKTFSGVNIDIMCYLVNTDDYDNGETNPSVPGSNVRQYSYHLVPVTGGGPSGTVPATCELTPGFAHLVSLVNFDPGKLTGNAGTTSNRLVAVVQADLDLVNSKSTSEYMGAVYPIGTAKLFRLQSDSDFPKWP